MTINSKLVQILDGDGYASPLGSLAKELAFGTFLENLETSVLGVTDGSFALTTIDLSAAATGVANVSLADNLAAAWTWKEGSNNYLVVTTTDGSESIGWKQRLTTTDGVSSGTAKVVGGRAYSATSASDNVTAAASNNAHVDFAQTYAIPANTLKAGSVVKIRALVHVTDASGTDTLEVKLYIGGTTLVTSTAVDPSTTSDAHHIVGELVCRAAPGAAVDTVGMFEWKTKTSTTEARGTAILPSTNLATNGALTIKASAKWSSNTASTSARLEILNVNID